MIAITIFQAVVKATCTESVDLVVGAGKVWPSTVSKNEKNHDADMTFADLFSFLLILLVVVTTEDVRILRGEFVTMLISLIPLPDCLICSALFHA